MNNFRDDVKGVILAGGSGTRLYPLTKFISKQLLHIYDKPMIYYPLSVLVNSGVRCIMIITTPEDQNSFKDLLGNGSQWGIEIEYATQKKPEGIAQALIISEEWVDKNKTILMLGDNLFFGPNLNNVIRNSIDLNDGATIFGYRVADPERFGVFQFDENNNVLSIEEKPKNPKSDWAVTGLYIYDDQVGSYARKLKKSERGEYEITDVNKEYLSRGELRVELFTRGFAWLDTGTHETLILAGDFVHTIEQRQGLKIACIEEIAYLMGYIDREQLASLAQQIPNQYGQYLKEIVARESN